ncbi:MAG: hypothetical protein EPO25_11415 [Gammaproteobacteria bacterium]|nr:MAG: hypothetical protein EPO25_11415 [Gammaproteobacteria bacterium]
MGTDTRDWLSGLQRPWAEVEAQVAQYRARSFRAGGAEAAATALWAGECELRQSLGYSRARELDLRHHVEWRNLLDQLAGKSAR